MYLLYLKGAQEPISISEEDYEAYKQAKEFIADGEDVSSVEMGCGDFQMSQIKAVVKSGSTSSENQKRDKDYTTDELKEIIGSYEIEKRKCLTAFLESKGVPNPAELSTEVRIDCLRGHGFTSIYISTYFGATTEDGKIIPDKYQAWDKKESALHELMCRREYMEKMKEKSLEGQELPPEASDEIDVDSIPF